MSLRELREAAIIATIIDRRVEAESFLRRNERRKENVLELSQSVAAEDTTSLNATSSPPAQEPLRTRSSPALICQIRQVRRTACVFSSQGFRLDYIISAVSRRVSLRQLREHDIRGAGHRGRHRR